LPIFVLGTNDGLNSKDGDLHQKEDVTLIIPELNLLSEVSHGDGPSDPQRVTTI
jgi:hypothetical protein